MRPPRGGAWLDEGPQPWLLSQDRAVASLEAASLDLFLVPLLGPSRLRKPVAALPVHSSASPWDGTITAARGRGGIGCCWAWHSAPFWGFTHAGRYLEASWAQAGALAPKLRSHRPSLSVLLCAGVCVLGRCWLSPGSRCLPTGLVRVLREPASAPARLGSGTTGLATQLQPLCLVEPSLP